MPSSSAYEHPSEVPPKARTTRQASPELPNLDYQPRGAIGPASDFSVNLATFANGFTPQRNLKTPLSPMGYKWRVMRQEIRSPSPFSPISSQSLGSCTRPGSVQGSPTKRTIGTPRDLKAIEMVTKTAAADSLVEMFADNDQRVRQIALSAFSKLGEQASLHSEKVVPLLKDENSNVRRTAAKVLESTKKTASVAQLLEEDDWQSRVAGAEAISAFGASCSFAAPKLAGLLKEDHHEKVRVAAATALGRIGEPAARHLKEITYGLKHDPCTEVRVACVTALGQLGEAGVAHAHLLVTVCEETKLLPLRAAKGGKGASSSLKDSANRALVLAAVVTLGKIGHEAASPECSTALALHIKDDDPVLRLEVVRTLSKLDDGKLLAELLLDTGGKVHQTVIEVGCSIYKNGTLQSGQAAPQFPEVMFRDDVRDGRRAAAEAIGQLGEQGAPHAGALAAALKSYHRQVRCVAAEALGLVGVSASAHLTALAAALKDEAHTVRQKAAEALGRSGNSKMLAELLQDTDAEMREAAARGLGVVADIARQHTQALVDALNDRNFNVRRAVVEVLHQSGCTICDRAVFALAKALKDSDARVRQVAAQLLRDADDAATAPYAGTLAEALQAGDQVVCCVAEEVLSKIGSAAAPHANAIVNMLKDPRQNWHVRLKSAEILGKIGKADLLAELLVDKHVEVREAALHGLAALGEGAVLHVNELALMLKDDDARLRKHTQALLIRIGEAAAPHAAAIVDLLKDPQCNRASEVRLAASRILARIGKTELLAEQLQQGSMHKNPAVRVAAAHGLGSCSKAASAHANVLVEALADKDETVRNAAIEGLAKPHVVSNIQIVALSEMVKSQKKPDEEETAVRLAAATVLGAVGQTQLLVKLLHSSEWWLRQAACFGFGALGEAAQAHSGDIVEALKDDSREVVRAATVALSRIFPRCKKLGVVRHANPQAP